MSDAAGSKSKVRAWLRTIGVAVLCVFFGYVARIGIDTFIQGQVPFVTFYPAVMAASLIAGVRSGILAVALASPFAATAFTAYPVATVVIWLALGTVVAVGCGLAHDLRLRLRRDKEELELAKQKLELVIREQTHRAKNTFAILNALAQQSAHGAHNIADFRDRLIARIGALSSAYRLMSSGEGDAPVDLGALAAVALAPFRDSYGERVAIEGGPGVSIAPSAAVPIALCLHELATNAVKYGGLSREGGVVRVAWSTCDAGGNVLRWQEIGGPSVEVPVTTGFGSRLIRSALNGVPGGSAVLKFQSDGVTCDLTFSAA